MPIYWLPIIFFQYIVDPLVAGGEGEELGLKSYLAKIQFEKVFENIPFGKIPFESASFYRGASLNHPLI